MVLPYSCKSLALVLRVQSRGSKACQAGWEGGKREERESGWGPIQTAGLRTETWLRCLAHTVAARLEQIIGVNVVWLVHRFQREAEAAKRAAADDKQRLEFEIASMRVYTDTQ